VCICSHEAGAWNTHYTARGICGLSTSIYSRHAESSDDRRSSKIQLRRLDFDKKFYDLECFQLVQLLLRAIYSQLDAPNAFLSQNSYSVETSPNTSLSSIFTIHVWAVASNSHEWVEQCYIFALFPGRLESGERTQILGCTKEREACQCTIRGHKDGHI
jgi:hypothetical protein